MKADQRHLPRIVYATAATIVLWGAHLYAREFLRLQPGDTLRLTITSALVIAFVCLIVEQVRQSRHLDEFHRQVQCLALGIAFPLTLVLLFGLGFFRGEGLFAGADSRDLIMLPILSYAA